MAVSFGIVLLVNDQTVALQPKRVAGQVAQQAGSLRANGMELELDKRLELGSPGEGIDALVSLVQKFDKDFTKPTANTFPAEIKDVVTKLSNVEIAVEKFHLKIPGTASTDKTIRYTVGMSAIFPPGDELSVDGVPVALKGVFFEASNNDAAAQS